MFVGVGLSLWTVLLGFSFLQYNPALLFLGLGDLFALVSIPLLLRQPGFFKANFRVLIASLSVGVLAAVVSGWIYAFQIVTPAGGGLSFGYPFAWRFSDQFWLGRQVMDSYDWEGFVLDFLFYSGIACAVAVTSRLFVGILRLRLRLQFPMR